MEPYEYTSRDGIRFVQVSAAYIDVSFGGHVSDCIGIWDYQTGACQVETYDDFRGFVHGYLLENAGELSAHWDAAFYATVSEGMS